MSGDGGGEYGVAGRRRRSLSCELSRDQRPRRVTVPSGQIQAAKTRRTTGYHERTDDADRLRSRGRQVRDAFSHQLGYQARIGLISEQDEVRPGPISLRAHVRSDSSDRSCHSSFPWRTAIGDLQSGGRRVGRSGRTSVTARDMADSRGGKQACDARPDAARAVHADLAQPAPHHHPGTAVAVSMGER
jgi:hypothetical protein